MRRLALAVLVAALPLAAAAPAAAKEAVKAKVCGQTDCVETTDRGVLAAFMEGGPPAGPPEAGAAWYRVEMTVDIGDGNHDTFPMAVAPRARVMGGSNEPGGTYQWYEISPEAAKAYTRIARGIDAMPPSGLRALGASPPEPAAARVDEVVQPPAPGGTPVWPWLLAAAGLGVLGVGAVALTRRTRRGRRPDAAGPDPLAH